MNSKPLNILVTRPTAPGNKLALTLTYHGYQAHSHPFLDYQAKASKHTIQTAFASLAPALIIFVSVPAVNLAHATYHAKNWPICRYIAVGQATQQALNDIGISDVITPELQTSEGLLALPQTFDVNNKAIIIVRGDGGRELIAEQLRSRGAQVSYIESYQRLWLPLEHSITQQWLAQGINCILATSNEILKSIVQLIDNQDNYWKNDCKWIVASERIAQQAKALGLKQVICSHGASDSAIISCLKNLEQDHDKNQ